MSSTIRPAVRADIAALFDIRTSVRQNHLSIEQLAGLGITPETIAETIAAAPCAWIAEQDGQPAGFAMADLDAGEVFALFIKPAFEGLGLGRQLLSQAEAALFQHHPVIRLTTDGDAAIRANGFYQRQGWRQAGLAEGGDVVYEKRREG